MSRDACSCLFSHLINRREAIRERFPLAAALSAVPERCDGSKHADAGSEREAFSDSLAAIDQVGEQA
jgi:hypothetical protein